MELEIEIPAPHAVNGARRGSVFDEEEGEEGRQIDNLGSEGRGPRDIFSSLLYVNTLRTGVTEPTDFTKHSALVVYRHYKSSDYVYKPRTVSRARKFFTQYFCP